MMVYQTMDYQLNNCRLPTIKPWTKNYQLNNCV